MYPTTRRNYTDEFKIQAVALAETLGRTEAARQLEMSVKTLDNWVNASRNGQPLSSPEVAKIKIKIKIKSAGFESRAWTASRYARQ
ncbi:transposase [Pseudomonas putida]|uniref:transposase n=1 Tax=Pseudomonas putida TaxID=303 RepID=UPI0029DE8C8B|nr:transposase [Pseudomonas putida]WPJ99245.1 transposase [Pseudomonas putida]